MSTSFWARFDSNSAKNPALNLTGDAAVEISFVAAPGGDLFLDHNAGGIDPNTYVVINGVEYSFTFELSATLPTLKKDGAQQVPDRLEGSQVYTITVHDYPTAGSDARMTFLPDGTATEADMNSFGNGAVDLQQLNTTTTGVICYAAGTHLQTPRGEVRVEDLEVGDLVMTRDRGAIPIRWISKTDHAWPGSSEKELPILISKGALGPDLPTRDLVVSPQHGIALGQNGHEVLAPAKGLTKLRGIRQMKGRKRVSYYHVLFDSHQLVLAEGILSESYYPGEIAQQMLKPNQRLSLYAALSGLHKGYGAHVRRRLSVQQATESARQITAGKVMALSSLQDLVLPKLA